MARINKEHAESLGGKGMFFKLDDGESAIIRLPYESLDDLFNQCFYRAHDVNSNTKDFKTIDCLIETADDPIDTCPLCEDGSDKAGAKMFIQIYDVEADEMKIWTTSKARIKDLNAHLADEDLKGNLLMDAELKIIRDGDDSRTRYNFKIRDFSKFDLKDFPEEVDIYESKALLKLTADEMDSFLKSGRVPERGNSGGRETARRRLSSKGEEQSEEKSAPRSSRRRGGSDTKF